MENVQKSNHSEDYNQLSQNIWNRIYQKVQLTYYSFSVWW
jgi:hypothetical protein